MKKQMAFAIVTLVVQGAALACEPGTAEFGDTFFRYCDEARARAQEAQAVVPAATRATGNPDVALPTNQERRPEHATAAESRFPEEATTLVRRP
ncbi:MAG: hypothetical protein Q8L40_02090 [Burkholderiales bacterium]|nr:hypothetical protein [Burkholderiales bacterium]